VPAPEARRPRGRGDGDGRQELTAAVPLRILIIDDDETARYAIGSFATRPGTVIIEAENGLAGITRAQNEHPDIILLDLMMPGIGGHEVLQRLKGEPATAAIPVLVITSRFINDEERSQILTRAAAVINKGDLSREVVIRAMDSALSR
jgi:CheY-like chemotaxis protein